MISESKSERAVLGGGCFWCVEAVYQGLPGIKAVVSGYAGGKMPNPTYDAVTSGNTGHAEVVEIEYDPAVITYREVVDFFWKAHDPTTLNRQGADVGTQYRSVIFTNNETEREIAEASKAAAQPSFKSPIVTEIGPLDRFYLAEGYHQDFYDRNPGHPYNRAVIRPKLEKLR
ncbi:MAG: peptide-methionine (S)-S-oxide reductase MsrA [Chthoniobacterales bacterium]